MTIERKRRQQEITAKLIHIFEEILDENQDLWFSFCCCSDEDRQERIIIDERYHDEFLSLLTDLVKIVK